MSGFARRFLVATAGVTAYDWNESLPRSNAPAPHWIDWVIVMPANDEAGVPVRYIEFTSRARRVGSTRVLWDGIATDITRQKEIELALTRSREELRELAGHLARVRESSAQRSSGTARRLGSRATAKVPVAWLQGHARRRDAGAERAVERTARFAITRRAHHAPPASTDLDQGIAARWSGRRAASATTASLSFADPEEMALAHAQAIVVSAVPGSANNVAGTRTPRRSTSVVLDDEGHRKGARRRRGIGRTIQRTRELRDWRHADARSTRRGRVAVGVRDDVPVTSVR